MVNLWDVESSHKLFDFHDHEGNINAVRFLPESNCLASCSDDKTVKIFDLRSNQLLQHYNAHKAAVNEISFHPTGLYMASCSDDSKIKIWDLRKGKALFTLYSHTGAVNAVDFSFAGDYFATGGDDKNLLVWKSNFYDSRTREADFIEQKVSTAKSAVKVQVSAPAAQNVPDSGVVLERFGDNVLNMHDTPNISTSMRDEPSNLKVVEVEADAKINSNLDRIMNQMDKLFVMLKVNFVQIRTWRLELR